MKLEFKDFTLLSASESIEILSIRNTSEIRDQMTSTQIISIAAHNKWVTSLINHSDREYFAVKYNDEIVGAVYITDIDTDKSKSNWGLYFKHPINPFISTFAAYFLFEYIFNTINIDSLYLEVKISNKKAIAFDKSLGFETYKEDGTYKYMKMSSVQWEKSKKSALFKSLKSKISKVQFNIKTGDKNAS